MRRRRSGLATVALASALSLPILMAGFLRMLNQPRRDFLAWRYLQIGQEKLTARPMDRKGAALCLRRAAQLGATESILVGKAAQGLINAEDYSAALGLLSARQPATIDDMISYGQCLVMTGSDRQGIKLLFSAAAKAADDYHAELAALGPHRPHQPNEWDWLTGAEGTAAKLRSEYAQLYANRMNGVGYCLAEANSHLDLALQMTQTAVDIVPLQPAYLDSLGWVLYKLGREREATFYLERAVRHQLPRPDPVILYHLGAAYVRSHRPADARRMLDWSLSADPQRAAAADLLKRLNLALPQPIYAETPGGRKTRAAAAG